MRFIHVNVPNIFQFCAVYFFSVHYIEGMAYKLIEDNGVVVGVQYREKDSEKPKVNEN
jgi:tRNA(Leu) C34 or U34 (ribose-2'-O)-methylase TrmL